jgi:hypothetical protein
MSGKLNELGSTSIAETVSGRYSDETHLWHPDKRLAMRPGPAAAAVAASADHAPGAAAAGLQ